MVTLAIEHFSYEASDSPMLSDIHLTVEKGSCAVFAGRSGCGKSTLLRLVNRLIPGFYKGNLEGSILIDGKNINDYSGDELVVKVGCVFQNPSSQFFNVDTESEIAFGCENLGIDRVEIRRRVMETAETLKITHLLDRSIFSLSGGEKQMIAIASVYAMGADVFLMDEPSANLDSKATEQLKRIITILKGQGKTVIIAEHRLHYLKDVADRLIVLERGEIGTTLDAKAIRAMTTDALHGMGLRAMELQKQILMDLPVTEESCIQVNDLTVCYSNQPAVINGVSEHFNKGIINGIVGYNGRGKSTFAKCLCGMLKERLGTVTVEGKCYSSKKRLGKIYMVLQNTTSQLFADSVAGELELAERTSKIDCNYSHQEVLAMLDLLHLKNRHPMSLSGGEKQRLAIAVGIVQNAEAIVLDEPTSGLDYRNMLLVKNLLQLLKDRGKYIIVITHDHEFLTTVCDRVIEI